MKRNDVIIRVCTYVCEFSFSYLYLSLPLSLYVCVFYDCNETSSKYVRKKKFKIRRRSLKYFINSAEQRWRSCFILLLLLLSTTTTTATFLMRIKRKYYSYVTERISESTAHFELWLLRLPQRRRWNKKKQ